MNKKLLIVAGVVGLVLVAGIGYVLANKMSKTNTSPPASAQPGVQPEVAKKEEPTQPQPGAYKEYDAATVAATKGTKILFFHAQWCPQCRALDADLNAGQIPENVTIFKVNYDTAQDLRQKYGVTLQTTLVKIDDTGNFVKKYVAYDEPTLTALIRNLL